jgi:hypothetical protein
MAEDVVQVAGYTVALFGHGELRELMLGGSQLAEGLRLAAQRGKEQAD